MINVIDEIRKYYIFEEEIEDFCEDITDIVEYYNLNDDEDCNDDENYV